MPDDLGVPPAAPVEPREHEMHGRRWTDEYGWMRERSDPRLTAYLRAEREYYDAAASRRAHLQVELFREVEQRLLPTDTSVSKRHGSRFYYTRTVTGSDYEQFFQTCDPNVPGTLVLDTAEHAGEDGFVEIGLREPSPDGRLLAYSVDTTGDEVYELRFRTTDRPRDLPDRIERSYYTGAWSSDSSTFFYIVHDELFRPYQLWRHTIGTPVAEDVLVLEESDARFEVTVGTSTDEAWIIATARSRTTSECHLIPAGSPASPPRLVRPRVDGVQYRIDAEGDRIIAVTNATAAEFEAALFAGTLPEGLPPVQPGERLYACHALRDFWLLELRRDGLPRLRAVSRKTGSAVKISADSPAAVVTLDHIHGYAHSAVVIRQESLVQPPSWYETDLSTGERRLLKRLEVPGYDESAYRTRRDHATAPDGTRVPVTLAWHAGTPLDGTAPAMLWSYGAYEICTDPEFDPMLPSLLDRGVVYALGHPRGGGENGRGWWLDGHLAAKTNTFDDHIAIADWLAGEGLPEPPGVRSAGIVDGRRIVTRGLSAGGLLQGAVYARRPGRWAAVIAEVPFVDVVTSMLDPSVPLTVNEWEEWGDPRKPDEFAWLWAYSPYENQPGDRRPPMLVTGALHDPRVMVHEPAKWVARLRSTAQPEDGPLYLRVELGAGAHTGPAGRYAHFRYEAELLAFALEHLGVAPR